MEKSYKRDIVSIKTSLCFFFFFVFLLHVVDADNSSFVPSDKILLSCGAPSDTTDSDGLKWTSDIGSKFAAADENSLTSPAATQDPSVPQVPFMTARVFKSEFTYSFPVSTGHKFIRFYFYPDSYSGLNASDAHFAVTCGEYTLMKNFSAYQTAQALNFAFIIKEFSLNTDSERLNITFTPSKASNAFAFVNGIEIVSMPDIYSSTSDGPPLFVVGQTTQYYIDNSTALENVYRLNVGGNDISPTGDTGMLRSWFDDSPYIFGAAIGVTDSANSTSMIRFPGYVAPVDVYATARTMGPDPNVNVNYNLTWIFTVDSGFLYLVRLHFCELEFTKQNQRVFDIFLNNQTAQPAADVIAWTERHTGIPIYKDYMIIVPQGQGQQDMWLALHPNVESKSNYYNAILNGVEIFKVNDSTGNLAGPNPIPPPVQVQQENSQGLSSSSSGGSKKVISGSIAGGVSVASLLCLVVFFVFRRQKQRRDSNSSDGPSGWLPLSLYGNSHSSGSAQTNTTGSYASSLPSNLCRHFSFAEIKAATKNFDEALILGVGGFGKVYKGEIDGGTTKVAIKRANPSSEQGVHEFQTEIEMLSKLRHRHLVSLIGYCEEKCEMILVYDYMAHGTLREHLYKTQKPPLTWKQRLEIAIGAARGLHYLHTGAKYTIIHRDVKTTNILLDEKWVAKVSDFGLSKTGPTLDHTHVSTVVKGSFGYLDPEYFRRQQLTDKSDVYSFGVVLFELLCARPALNPALPKEQVSLAEWALHCQKKGMLDQIMDPYLEGKTAPECFKKFAETAEKCVADQGIDRPSMGDVLWNLEFALQLQESAEESGTVIQSDMDIEETPFKKGSGEKDPDGYEGNMADSRTSGMSRSIVSEASDGLTPSQVFSQIMNPKGR